MQIVITSISQICRYSLSTSVLPKSIRGFQCIRGCAYMCVYTREETESDQLVWTQTWPGRRRVVCSDRVTKYGCVERSLFDFILLLPRRVWVRRRKRNWGWPTRWRMLVGALILTYWQTFPGSFLFCDKYSRDRAPSTTRSGTRLQ